MNRIKRNTLSDNLWNYNIGLLGESGIGKTTTMSKVCELLVGDNGYVVFNMGKEDGVSCLENVPYIDIPDWKTFEEVTSEIIANKTTDYSDLKIILIDTLDQLFEIVEPEVIRRWNVENRTKKDFQIAKTLNASWGSFGRGEDKALEIVLDRMWKLKSAGIAFWFCGHVKTRDVIDPVSSSSYTTLTTNMMQIYFNGIKTKFHIIGIACINREIVKEKTGRKNIVSKQDITINRVKAETREIVFRDNNYAIDSKSRFAEITDRIPLDAATFISTLKEAIKKEKSKGKSTVHKIEVAPIQDIELGLTNNDDIDELGLSDNTYPENITEIVKEKFKSCQDTEIKKQVAGIIKTYGKLTDVDESGIRQIYDLLI